MRTQYATWNDWTRQNILGTMQSHLSRRFKCCPLLERELVRKKQATSKDSEEDTEETGQILKDPDKNSIFLPVHCIPSHSVKCLTL